MPPAGIPALAAILSVSPSTARRLVKDGAVRTIRVRGLLRISEGELARIASPGTTPPGETHA